MTMRVCMVVAILLGVLPGSLSGQPPRSPAHVVFVTGDEEYRSEESMPMLARILKRDHGVRVTVLYALDSTGVIDPNRADNIPGLDALRTADLMVLFTRFRALPDSQLRAITEYAESGRPMVGFRTSTHAFRYPNDPGRAHLNEEWPRRIFGQRWIVHHGHFDDGAKPLTEVQLVPWKGAHPVLRGVSPFQAYSWLYHVDGGEHELQGDVRPLLVGRALRTTHADTSATRRYPLVQPVAWTKSYTGASGRTARVFFTTLGHPYDFRDASMRKLALNGMLWALGWESRIPADGAGADVVGRYEPNNSGFGKRYKPGMRPAPL